MSRTVVVYISGISGMDKKKPSTWATANDFPTLSMSRRMTRTGDGKTLTQNEAPEHYNIPLQLSLSDNMTGDLHENFAVKMDAIEEVIMAVVADRNSENYKPIYEVVLSNVITQHLTIDADVSSGNYYVSTVFDFQKISTSYGSGNKKLAVVWDKGVRNG